MSDDDTSIVSIVTLSISQEQRDSWTTAAGDRDLATWIALLADRASGTARGPVVIKLRNPIKYGSRLVEELTVRPVKGKHMRAVNKSDSPMATTMMMAGKLTGEVSQVIDELEGEDLRDVLEAVNSFFFAIQ